MGFATDEVKVKRLNDCYWQLLEPLEYQGRDDCWTVPAGFETDFATVPQFVTWLIPITGRYTQAAILHDYFCSYGIKEGIISGRDTDAVFRRVMRELEVPFLRRWVIWLGVRWGALVNPIRNKNWWKDLHKIIPLTILVAPLVIPASILALVALGMGWIANKIVALFGIE